MSHQTKLPSNMNHNHNNMMEDHYYNFTDCILQGSDVLALHGLDDDDTTQSSALREDRSCFLNDDNNDNDDDGSIYNDATDGSQRVVLHAYQTVKNIWSRGKETIGVGTVLGWTESACCAVANAIGIGDIEKELVKPKLLYVDEGLQPTYSAIANVLDSWVAAPNKQQEEEAVPSTPVFEVEIPEGFGEFSDEDDWVPLD